MRPPGSEAMKTNLLHAEVLANLRAPRALGIRGKKLGFLGCSCVRDQLGGWEMLASLFLKNIYYLILSEYSRLTMLFRVYNKMIRSVTRIHMSIPFQILFPF